MAAVQGTIHNKKERISRKRANMIGCGIFIALVAFWALNGIFICYLRNATSFVSFCLVELKVALHFECNCTQLPQLYHLSPDNSRGLRKASDPERVNLPVPEWICLHTTEVLFIGYF